MANKKMTQRDYYNAILALENLPTDIAEFVKGRIEALDKKSGKASGKPTATQVANKGIKNAIVEGMTPNMSYTITDIIKSIPACAELTNQKVSALVRQLIAEGVVVRTEDKGKAYFTLA